MLKTKPYARCRKRDILNPIPKSLKMTNNSKISGIPHITAIASSTSENLAFYEKVLGLRLVKKTVNFDDPYTYHLYYGDPAGAPGTIITFL